MDENGPQDQPERKLRLTGEALTRYQIDQLQAKLRRQRAANNKSARDIDNRECQLYGVLTKRYFMPRDPDLRARYLKAADIFFWRDDDREFLGLPLLDEEQKKKRRRGHWDDVSNDEGNLKTTFEKEKA